MNKYMVLNEDCKVIFKTENIEKLYEYIENLCKEDLIKKYVGKKLSFDDLSIVAFDYNQYDRLRLVEEQYDMDGNIEDFIRELRCCLNDFDLMLAY